MHPALCYDLSQVNHLQLYWNVVRNCQSLPLQEGKVQLHCYKVGGMNLAHASWRCLTEFKGYNLYDCPVSKEEKRFYKINSLGPVLAKVEN